MCIEKPKFAVLLAAYNGMRWIEEQVNSILMQENVEVRLFISIDPSSDGMREWCEALVAKEARVVLLPDVGVFWGAAKNFFRLIRDVDFTEFDYVSFADQDDIWFKDKLISAHSKIIEHNSDAYSGNVMAFWVDGRKVLIRKSQAQKKWDFLFEAAGPGCTYVLKNKLAAAIKKTIVTNWHDIQEVYLHDWFCYAFARANDYKWFIDAEPKMLYRQHENNQVGINSGVHSLLTRLRKVVNGYGLEQSKLIGNLVGLGGDAFFMSWSGLRRVDKLKLAFCAMNCRRRFRDQIYFFLVCVFLSLIPDRLKC